MVAIPGEPADAAMNPQKLIQRINESKKMISQCVSKVNITKAKGLKKAVAREKYEQSIAAFKKYDTDKDGKLSRREIQTLSKKEYGFQLDSATIDKIVKVCIKEDAKGVEKELFPKVKVMIGIAREMAIDAEKVKEKEAKEKELSQKKENYENTVKEVNELIAKVAEDAVKTEKHIFSLLAQKEVSS